MLHAGFSLQSLGASCSFVVAEEMLKQGVTSSEVCDSSA
jgi:hypothetical protein